MALVKTIKVYYEGKVQEMEATFENKCRYPKVIIDGKSITLDMEYLVDSQGKLYCRKYALCQLFCPPPIYPSDYDDGSSHMRCETDIDEFKITYPCEYWKEYAAEHGYECVWGEDGLIGSVGYGFVDETEEPPEPVRENLRVEVFHDGVISFGELEPDEYSNYDDRSVQIKLDGSYIRALPYFIDNENNVIGMVYDIVCETTCVEPDYDEEDLDDDEEMTYSVLCEYLDMYFCEMGHHEGCDCIHGCGWKEWFSRDTYRENPCEHILEYAEEHGYKIVWIKK